MLFCIAEDATVETTKQQGVANELHEANVLFNQMLDTEHQRDLNIGVSASEQEEFLMLLGDGAPVVQQAPAVQPMEEDVR